ncbi:hypothetical protein ABBQ32_006189 [Trebouxia sp. C0010 RCD-2024]
MVQAMENGHMTADQQAIPGPGAIVPAGPVKSVLPSPNLSAVKVDTQTKAIGVIQPPPDIRAIVDKTAQFVAKNGTQFEGRILANEKDNPKFNFLRTADPFHAYYRHMVTEHQKGTDGAQPAVAAQPDQQTAEQQKLAAGPAAGAVAVEPPEEEKYTVHVPEGLTYFDLDLIKLTAQFVARNGKGFLTGLAGKEHSNPQFMFLKPTHSMFGFFTSLCDAYSRLLMPDKGLMQKLKKDADDRTAILERCLRRLEFDKARDAEAKAQADQLEAERMAMQSIDWHDFVVVETIEFDEDEDDELPMLLTQRDVVLMNKAGPLEEEDQEPSAAQMANGDARDMEMSEEEKAMVAEADAAAAPVTTAADEAAGRPALQPLPEEPRQSEAAPTPQERKEDDMDMDVDEEPMRIVRNYQRHGARAQEGSKVVVSPITGDLIPVDQMAEHMRISLIDPKFQEQRQAMMSKIRETTKASDDEIGRNLMGLARKRPDVFGSTQEEMGALVQQSINDSKISGGDRPVAWDGETRSGAGLQNQLKQIQDSKVELGKRKEPEGSLPPPPRLGPQPPQPSSLPPPVMRPTPAAPVGPQAGAPQSLPPPPVMAPRPQAPPQLPPPAQGPPQLAPPQMRPPPFGLPLPQRPPMMPGALPPRPMMPGMPGAPPSGPPPMGPPPGGPPDAKRQRTGGLVLEPEEEFLAKYPGPSKVLLLCPNSDESDMLNGQLLEVEVASLQDTVGELKSRLADVVGIAANKQKIGRDQLGFLRDELTLAHYNVSPDIQLTLGVKERGGRKK